MSVIESYLREIELFDNFPPETLKSLAAICRKRKINKKEILFTEGDPGRAVYYCIEGYIQLYKSDEQGRQTVIKVIQSGELFGEVILFERDTYPVTAMALSQGVLIVIPKSGFYSLLNDLQFRNQFVGILIKKQRYLVDKIRSLTAVDIEERIYHFLKEQFGEKLEVEPKLSKKDVAAAIGTVPETLSRVLLRLKKEKKLSWDFDKIVINPDWKGK
jgi:CRP/FNR family transcriptional regulator